MMFMKQKLFTLLALLTVAVSGAWATTTVVYERTLTSWTSNDVNKGAGTWIANAATADTEKGLYVSGTGNRNATLTFSHIDNSIQTIDLVFNNATNTGDTGNYSYVDIGNSIRIRSNQQAQNGHVIINGVETAISHCNVKDINRGGDLWTIHVEIDTKENKLTALTLAGNVGGANAASFTLAEATLLGTAATYNTVALGTNRVKGSPSAGIQSIRIAETIDTYTVHVNDGQLNPTTWTAKAGDATEFSTLPLGGVTEGQTVTLQYNGSKRVKEVKATAVTLETPLTLLALSDGTIVVSKPMSGMQYSKNGAAKTSEGIEEITVKTGDKVAFYGDGTNITTYYVSSQNYTKIAGGTATVMVYGNIMSLVDEEGFATATTLTGNNAFQSLFDKNTTLTDASNLLLPATTLTQSCYESMFNGCKNLTAAPELKAETLVAQCYYGMFDGCTKLGNVTCLATDIDASSLTKWLDGAGTEASEPKLYVLSSMLNATWNNGSFTVTAIPSN